MPRPRAPLRVWQKRWLLIRDVLLFLIGFGGVAWETLHGPVDPSLLVFFGGCLGIPVFLHKDKQ